MLPNPFASGDAPAPSYARTIPAEENDAVINVNPSLVVDPLGGFLVVDVSESQVRRYDGDGGLMWHAGRQGRGPGEFTAPTAVGRMERTGEVVVAERNGRLTFLDADGARTVRTVETRLSQVEEMVVVNDSTLLLSGIGTGGIAGDRLHLWDTRRDTLLHSFFSPFPRQRNRTAATVAGFVEAAVRQDAVAAVFAASDTIYFFDLQGRARGQVPLQSAHFRSVPDREPGRTITNPRERAEWVSSFDLVADVSWLPDGSLAVAWQRLDATRALERQWRLLRMTRDGAHTDEVPRSFARLVGTDSRTGDAYLVDEAAEAPNEWSVLRLVSSSR